MTAASTLSRLAALALVLAAAACEWPSAGAGGMAERGRPASPAVEQAVATLDRLKAQGADRFAAADLVEARLLLNRVEREYAGGLKAAAESDLIRLNMTFEKIEQRLATAPQSASRTKPAEGGPRALH